MRIAASLIAGPRSVLTVSALADLGAEIALVSTHERHDDLVGRALPNLPAEQRHRREQVRSGDLGTAARPPVGDEIGGSSRFAMAALAMLDRANWSGANVSDMFRLYQRFVGYWREHLANAHADVCWFDGVPHQAQDWALYQVCDEYAVPTFVTAHTVFDRSPVLYRDIHDAPIPVAQYVAAAHLQSGSTSSRYLAEVVADLVDQDALARQRSLGELARGGFGRVVDVGRTLARPVPDRYPQMVPSWPRRGVHRTANRVRARTQISRQARSLLALPTAVPDDGRPMVHFPLHFQPEMTTVPLGMPHLDQVSAIRAIAHAVEGEATVVVKEHPQMLKWTGSWGRARSPDFYRDLLAIPGVTMVSPAARTADLVGAASVVATLTGTAGYEARQRTATTVCFGAPWYQHFRGVHRVRDSAQLRAALDSGLSSPASELTQPEIDEFVATYTIQGAWTDSPPGERESYWPERYAGALHAAMQTVTSPDG